MTIAEQIKAEICALGSPQKADKAKRFFKTGEGGYGAEDIFCGCTMPELRTVAKTYKRTPLDNLQMLIDDDIHECRMCALLILIHHYRTEVDYSKAVIIDFYLKNAWRANNWDLVDASAPAILGNWLLVNPNRTLLDDLSDSQFLWRQRIAIVSTQTLIKAGLFDDTLYLCVKLMHHPHDLMHKACGWMLREVGKQHNAVLLEFLEQHACVMPRTMLRYAIEKLSGEQRQYFMTQKKSK